MKRLSFYGPAGNPAYMAMVGKGKAVPRLVERMPSPEIVAKVGAGGQVGIHAERTHTVVRRNALKTQA